MIRCKGDLATVFFMVSSKNPPLKRGKINYEKEEQTQKFLHTFVPQTKKRSTKMFNNRTAQNWWWRSLVFSKQ